MRQLALVGPRQLEVRDVPAPALQCADDVRIRVAVVGVCGSDVHYYARGRIGEQVVAYPLVMGHEAAGVVAEIGPGVTRVRVGDRVALDPAISCGECDQCRAGRRHTCCALRFMGAPGQADGCFAEEIIAPQQCCYPLPPGLTLEQGAMSEPLSIGVYAVSFACGVAKGASDLAGLLMGRAVGVLGVGPIGLCTLQVARVAGAKRVLATDRIDERLRLAERLGADLVANVDATDVVAACLRGQPSGLDVVFECCGEQAALDQAVELLRPGGVLAIVGIPEQQRVSLPIHALRRRELRIVNIRRQNECTTAALDLIARGAVDVDALITQRVPLEASASAFEAVSRYAPGWVKATVECGG